MLYTFILIIGIGLGGTFAWLLRDGLDRRRNAGAGDLRSGTSGGTSADNTPIARAEQANAKAGDAIEGIQNLMSRVREHNSRSSNTQ